MTFRKICCCCFAPKPVAAEEILCTKRKEIMKHVHNGFMIDEIYDFLMKKVGVTEEKPEPKKKKTFKQIGKATRMGVLANLKSNIANNEIEEDKELPFLLPTRQKKMNWSFKAVANFFRYGPGAPQNKELSIAVEENLVARRKFTLKGLGKMSKLGLFKKESVDTQKQKFTLKGLGKMSKLGLFKNEAVEKQPQKFSLKGLGKMSKLGLFKNESVQKQKQKFTLKGLGKMSKLGLFKNEAVQTAKPRRKTLKSFGKASMLGVRTRGTQTQIKPKQRTLTVNKPKRKLTFKSIGFGFKLGAAATGQKRRKHKKNKTKFKFLALFSKRGKSSEPVCTCGENQDDLYICTCSDSDED